MKQDTDISRILAPLDSTVSQAYLSCRLQLADILEWILTQVGPAEIWQTSFSISEEFLRRLYFIRQRHRISNIRLVLDHKATNKTISLWSFITQVIPEVHLADNHSKILLVRAESGQTVSVITSQNLTRGNRSESAFISSDPEIFKNLLTQISDLIRNHSVPLNDLFRQRTQPD